MSNLEKHLQNISKLCKKHKVRKLYAFGSVLTERFNEESDIDLIVDFSKINVEDYADNYFDLKFSLQNLLQRPIDLLENSSIKNPYLRKALDQKKQLVYG